MQDDEKVGRILSSGEPLSEPLRAEGGLERLRAIRVQERQQSEWMLDEFVTRSKQATIYRMIRKAPEKHRLLIALFCQLGWERFEALMSAYAKATLRIPTRAELRRWERNKKILEAFEAQVPVRKIGYTFGLSAPQVYLIVRTERTALRPHCSRDRQLLNEINAARKTIRRAIVVMKNRQRAN